MKKAKTGKGRNGMGGDYSRHYDYDYAQGHLLASIPPQLAISHVLLSFCPRAFCPLDDG
jgi:hypothetical protein